MQRLTLGYLAAYLLIGGLGLTVAPTLRLTPPPFERSLWRPHSPREPHVGERQLYGYCAKEPDLTSPARRYLPTMTPLGEVLLSTSAKPA